MIDPSSETLLTLTEAPKSKQLPSRPNSSTVWRWHTRGVRGVRLETIAIGGRRYTSEEAIGRFIQATTAAADGQSVRSTSAQRQREIDAAEAELERMGV